MRAGLVGVAMGFILNRKMEAWHMSTWYSNKKWDGGLFTALFVGALLERKGGFHFRQ